MARNPAHRVEVCFSSTRRVRYFPFLPRVGDQVEIFDGDSEELLVLEVDRVMFGHQPDSEEMSASIRCRVIDQS